MEEGGAARVSARLMATTDALRIEKKNEHAKTNFVLLSAESEVGSAKEAGASGRLLYTSRCADAMHSMFVATVARLRGRCRRVAPAPLRARCWPLLSASRILWRERSVWRERRRLLAQLPSHLLHAYAGAAGGSLHHYARAHALPAAPA